MLRTLFTSLLCLFALAAQAEECASIPQLNTLFSENWGFGSANHRYQDRTSINRENVSSLALKWVFPLDDNMQPHSYPLVSDDTIFVGTGAGNVYALNRDSGCVRWKHESGEYIRTAIVSGEVVAEGEENTLLFFGTSEGMVHAIRATDGSLAWKKDVKSHPRSVVTGTPLYADGAIYVPLSSMELGLAMSPFYECCTSSGGLLKVDAKNGEILWASSTIDKPATESGRHWLFVRQLGPSGAPVWSSPALDRESGLVYVGTGENYTHPTTETSDAILAFDSATGKRRWAAQFTDNDAFNMACTISTDHPNCPEDTGPDYDFGAPPIIYQTKTGRTMILAGQKSSGVYSIDAASGETLWKRYLGRGGYLGGVHWGMAIHPKEKLLYAPMNDLEHGPGLDEPTPGLFALDIASGEIRWSATKEDRCEGREECHSGFSAAALATPDLVFTTVLDGFIYAVDARTGEFLWEYDSWREYEAVDGSEAIGGSIDVHGPMVAGKQLIVQSGYGSFYQKGGNALLVFETSAETGAETDAGAHTEKGAVE